MFCTRLCSSPRGWLSKAVSDSAIYEQLTGQSKGKGSNTSPESPSKPPNILNTLAPCVQIVKQYDYEHYLCILLAPVVARRGLMAVRAYNVELSRAAPASYSTQQEKEISRLKLLWWSSIIDDIYNDRPVTSPIAIELKGAVRRHKLSKGFLLKLIDSRSSAPQYNSLHDVETAADNTFSTVNYLSMETLGHKSVEIDHAASHLGRCEGLIGLIRSIPLLRAHRTTLVPNTTLAKVGISQHEIIENQKPEKLKDVVHEIASSAHVHMAHCEKLAANLPPSAQVGLLPLTPAKLFLDRLEKFDFDLTNGRTLVRTPFLTFILTKNKFLVGWRSMKSLTVAASKAKAAIKAKAAKPKRQPKS